MRFNGFTKTLDSLASHFGVQRRLDFDQCKSNALPSPSPQCEREREYPTRLSRLVCAKDLPKGRFSDRTRARGDGPKRVLSDVGIPTTTTTSAACAGAERTNSRFVRSKSPPPLRPKLSDDEDEHTSLRSIKDSIRSSGLLEEECGQAHAHAPVQATTRSSASARTRARSPAPVQTPERYARTPVSPTSPLRKSASLLCMNVHDVQVEEDRGSLRSLKEYLKDTDLMSDDGMEPRLQRATLFTRGGLRTTPTTNRRKSALGASTSTSTGRRNYRTQASNAHRQAHTRRSYNAHVDDEDDIGSFRSLKEYMRDSDLMSDDGMEVKLRTPTRRTAYVRNPQRGQPPAIARKSRVAKPTPDYQQDDDDDDRCSVNSLNKLFRDSDLAPVDDVEDVDNNSISNRYPASPRVRRGPLPRNTGAQSQSVDPGKFSSATRSASYNHESPLGSRSILSKSPLTFDDHLHIGAAESSSPNPNLLGVAAGPGSSPLDAAKAADPVKNHHHQWKRGKSTSVAASTSRSNLRNPDPHGSPRGSRNSGAKRSSLRNSLRSMLKDVEVMSDDEFSNSTANSSSTYAYTHSHRGRAAAISGTTNSIAYRSLTKTRTRVQDEFDDEPNARGSLRDLKEYIRASDLIAEDPRPKVSEHVRDVIPIPVTQVNEIIASAAAHVGRPVENPNTLCNDNDTIPTATAAAVIEECTDAQPSTPSELNKANDITLPTPTTTTNIEKFVSDDKPKLHVLNTSPVSAKSMDRCVTPLAPPPASPSGADGDGVDAAQGQGQDSAPVRARRWSSRRRESSSESAQSQGQSPSQSWTRRSSLRSLNSLGRRSERSSRMSRTPRATRAPDYFASLTPAERNVMVHKRSEREFSGRYCNFSPLYGTFRCRACDTPLYSAHAKFDARNGFPSFDRCFQGAVLPRTEFLGIKKRTALACAKCKGHLGHLTTAEQLTETNERHTVNSVALRYDPIPISSTEVTLRARF